jgi:hypothetical protein
VADAERQEAALASRVESLTPEERARLVQALKQRRAGEAAAITRRADVGPAPLSFSQEALWFLEQWEPGAPTNHGTRATHLHGEVSAPALESALRTLVARHEILRTVYPLRERRPVQVALDEWDLSLPIVDLSGLPTGERQVELDRQLRDESRRPFDLERDLMIRPVLFRLGATEHTLLLTLHHIAADGWSGGVMNRELGEAYDAYRTGRRPELPELPIQYADFAVWQRAHLRGETLERLLAYWRAALEGAPTRLSLPTDRARPAVQMHRGRHLAVAYDGGLGLALRQLAKEQGGTPYMVLLAAFTTLLYRFTGQDDIVVGTPVANRGRAELENLIGFFSNTSVIRTRLDGNPTFVELVQRVREATIGAFEHQELPFERLVEALRVERDPSYNPLFQVNFRASAGPRAALALPGLASTPISVDIGFSRFDLALELEVGSEGVEGYFEYDEDLFEQATIESLASQLESLLAAIVAGPETPILALDPDSRRARRRPVRVITRTH